MPDLFKEIIPSILQTKKNVFSDEREYKDYKAYMVNRALSFHMDCVLYANEMNLHPGLDEDMQYQYLLNTVRPMKRKFQPWQRADILKDLECVKQYFGYSDEKARSALQILTEEQILQIKKSVDIGGTK